MWLLHCLLFYPNTKVKFPMILCHIYNSKSIVSIWEAVPPISPAGEFAFRFSTPPSIYLLTPLHKPLITIFHPAKEIPEMAVSKLQRWAITLSAYNYEVKYQPSDKHGNADALSRLPLDSDNLSIDNYEDTVCLLEQKN